VRCRVLLTQVADLGIHEYGCAGTSKFHHTTYLTIRDDTDPQIKSWEWGFNFLWDNPSKNGLHNYDQPDNTSGNLTTPMNIHHNVIVGQGGAGISYGGNTGWNIDVFMENNVLIDVGKAAAWDGINVDTSDGPRTTGILLLDGNGSGTPSTVYMRHNLVYKYKGNQTVDPVDGALGLYGPGDNITTLWDNNIAYTERDLAFVSAESDGLAKLARLTGGNNVWHYTGNSPANAVSPTWSGSSYSAAPEIAFDGAIVTVAASGSAYQNGNAGASGYGHDIYGVPRPAIPTIGPVESI
jgi:hypothetical protein